MLGQSLFLLIVFLAPSLAVTNNATCKTSGRFLDYTSPDCSGYILCIPTTDTGVFSLFNLKCPINFAFNPEINTCTNITNFMCSAYQIQFTCNSTGRFFNPNPQDAGCNTYIECFVQYNGEMKSRVLRCPNGLNFDPVHRACLSPSLYQCPEHITTTMRPTMTPGIGPHVHGKGASDKILPSVYLMLVGLLCNLSLREK